MRKLNFKKVLFGLSLSLVLAMAIGSFAIGDNQTPANTQLQTHSAVNAPDSGAFTVTATDGETVLTDNDYSYASGALTIKSATPMTIKNTNTGSTTDRIVIDLTSGSEANITLAGVNISTSISSALEIKSNATFNVNITLADGSTNTLTSTANQYAGLEKSDNKGASNVGALTIGVPADSTRRNGSLTATGGKYGAGIGGGNGVNGSNITISGGEVKATGGYMGAGIGSGNGGNGSYITISGGTVTATGGQFGAGIGGGDVKNGSNITISGGTVTATGGDDADGIGGGRDGSGSGNVLNGDAVVLATSGTASKAALDGFADDDLKQGITFTRQTETGDWTSNLYGDVALNQDLLKDLNIPVSLTIPENESLTIDTGATFTVPAGMALKNEGTLTINGDIDLSQGGEITTKTDFYLEGQTTVYKTGYQTYQTSEGVQKYKDLPNPDDTTLLKNSLNSDKFLYWYYLDKDGKEVAIKDGDAGDDVLPNQHKFYEKREEAYSIATSKQGEGTITPNVSEAYKGDEVTFTVTPAEGYELKEGSVSVKAGDKDVEFTEKDGKYTFTMPDSAVTISAVFEQIPTPTPPGPEPTPTPPGPEPQPTPPGPEPGPTPEPTPDPSVDPDGDGSGASSKTSDPFMGGIALALLGVATTGAILARKFK